MTKWTQSAKRADFKAISARFGVDQVIARLIRNRDVIGDRDIEKYLYGSVSDLFSPALLKDADKAAGIIIDKLKENASIRIVGDYDIDGIMSTYILYTALKDLGADADYAIPERIKDGYGLNENLVKDAYDAGRDTIITCDNGIAAFEQIKLAKDLGMTVIVTDHHNIPFEETDDGRKYIIPPADAVIDPKQEDCPYPYKELCGASVAWKLMQRTYELLGKELRDFLPFAAFATVGDVVDLCDENRIIVKEGLKRLRSTDHIGLNALIEKRNIDKASIDAYTIGFVLGPCLNASGRLDTAERAMSLMISDDRSEALKTAQELADLNESRKTMTAKGVEDALRAIESSTIKDDKVLVVYLENCHESIAGIIAGRLREAYHKPAFVLTKSDDEIKGSGRSIEEYDMYEELCKVKDLFSKFGGHKMAAGVTLAGRDPSQLGRRLNAICTLTDEDIEPKVALDMRLPIGYITEDLIWQLELLKPFGKGNPKPLFGESGLKASDCRLLGKNGNVLKMTLSDARGFSIEAVCFDDAAGLYERVCEDSTVMVSYYPSINEYRGKKSLQLIVKDYN